MAVVMPESNRQRVRVALFIRPRPLECRSRLLSRLPFGTPLETFCQGEHLISRTVETCVRWYNFRAERFFRQPWHSSLAFKEFTKAQ